ncbi:MAG: hypothetical protein IM618_14350 [Cytophagales bacterium]|nr:hypothetical protein [Cytophagales bacterium]
MKKRKLLYLDMDGVLADFDAGIKSFDPSICTLDHHHDFEQRTIIVEAICKANPTIFHTLPTIEGAVEAVHELFPLFDIYFLSTPMWSVPESFTGKRIWVETHFGAQAEKKLILSHRKDLNIGHYLVDDRLRNGVKDFKGQHIHFGTKRFSDWNKTKRYLISVAE